MSEVSGLGLVVDDFVSEAKENDRPIDVVEVAESGLKHPKARLCHLKKWSHFQGYGFNLHAEKAKTGQHIGKVDADSPAESAGLKEGDRIIEVNNVNISNENHQQVVKRIRNGWDRDNENYGDEVVLLVMDSEADAYYRGLNVIVKSDFKDLLRIRTESPANGGKDSIITPSIIPVTKNDQSDRDSIDPEQGTALTGFDSISSMSPKSLNKHATNIPNENIPNKTTDQSQHLHNLSVTSMTNKSTTSKDNLSSASNLSISSNNQSNQSSSNKVASPDVQVLKNGSVNSFSETKPNLHNINNNDIMVENRNNDTRSYKQIVDPFQMSAAEFKTYLKSKGRPDPRIAQVDMRQKFQMFQDM